MQYELKTALYEGPMEKLLGLIEARELPIAELSLSQVTDDFMKYLERITAEYRDDREAGSTEVSPEAYMRLIADFIVVASRLVFIKSKTLLPDLALSEEEEASIKDLEARLARYRELKPAMKAIAGLWHKGSQSYARPYFLHVRGLLLAIRAQEGTQGAFFYPAGVSVLNLRGALQGLLALQEAAVAEEELVQESIVTLEAKIQELFSVFKKMKATTFRGIANGASKTEAIVTFLAILHLAREQAIAIEQADRDSDILIRHVEFGTA